MRQISRMLMAVFSLMALIFAGCSDGGPLGPEELDTASTYDRGDGTDDHYNGGDDTGYERGDGRGDYGGSDR